MSGHVISVITPMFNPVPEYVQAAYNSLASQEMPSGWQWQWIVQEDGQTGDVAQMLPKDQRINAGSGRRGAPSTARNLGMARATGELIKVLDADDMLTPGVLARDIGTLHSQSNIGWTTDRVLDLLPDGSTIGFDSDPPEGRLECGAVFAHWRSHNYRSPVHPATLCIRRNLVFALGGWMALPGSGDTALLMALDVVSPGYFIAQPGLLYRKWEGQVTSQAAHTEEVEWQARMSIIEERTVALTSLWRARR